ncbi:hypothetical protein LTR37_004271 [Vermiconidia calcicola]|uniref:Uncharacterized protein n=1 Tax=Vermiconidia calcicola TaxID=1690605 RepID=A0ACC3NPI2_9PEZI|nr:hypothetical protein LTR37_004271 [Vermiconidia calcicola]
MPIELPVLTIANATAWTQWLIREANISKGVWLTLAKKGVTQPTSLTYEQALEEALCHGWIDGQARRGDEKTWSQRFTPRTAKSVCSQRNVGKIARLEDEGRMFPRGRVEVEKAKQDGRWEAAYAGQATMAPSAALSAAIAKIPEAQATWDVLTKQNRFAFCHRLAALKTEARREKRIAATVDMLSRGETPYPQKTVVVRGKPSIDGSAPPPRNGPLKIKNAIVKDSPSQRMERMRVRKATLRSAKVEVSSP